VTQQPQQPHWKEAALAKSEAISDAWEVTKVYAGRLAEWVLFGCMIANIVQVVLPVPASLANSILGVQAVTLDIAGFGLASMASEARRQGHEQAATQARVTAVLLIGLMILTLLLVTIGVLWPVAKPWTDLAEKVLLVGRVVMTVIYGHVVHGLRDAKQVYTNELARVQEERDRVQEELDRANRQVSSGEGEVSKLRTHLATKTKEVDGLRGQGEELRATVEQVTEQSGYELRATVARYEQEKQTMVTSYQEQVESLSCELQEVEDQLALANKRSTKATASCVAKHRTSDERRATDSSEQGYVAVDDGATVAVTNGYGKTLLATGSHRDRIKQAMVQAMGTGQAMNYQDIAQAAGVGYSTVKKYASAIRQELEQVMR